MPVITLEDWKSAVLAVPQFLQSAALRDLTRAFEVYMQRKTQQSLENLAVQLEVWSTTGPQNERTKLANARDDLRDTIAAEKSANVVIVARASNVGANRYYELVPPPAQDLGWIQPEWTPNDPEYVPALKPSEIQRINEAFSRTAKAVKQARDEAIKISAKSALGGSPVENDFREVFGQFDKGRARRVAKNFSDLVDALDLSVKLCDIRNSIKNHSNFAMCWQAHVARGANRRVTSRVDMFLARGFFTTYDEATLGRYKGTSASTVWTLVHELSHGTFYAVDAPRVLDDDSWELKPKTDVPKDADNYGASPENDKQSNGEELDLRLARKDPDIAICNADNYGLFAFRCMLRNGIG